MNKNRGLRTTPDVAAQLQRVEDQCAMADNLLITFEPIETGYEDARSLCGKMIALRNELRGILRRRYFDEENKIPTHNEDPKFVMWITKQAKLHKP